MHNELENLREKLSKAERLNEYLKKQIEIHHITHGNIDLLMEMAQELNFTKEELEAYKDKLARTKDIRDSLIKAANSKSLSGLYKMLIHLFILENFCLFFIALKILSCGTYNHFFVVLMHFYLLHSSLFSLSLLTHNFRN